MKSIRIRFFLDFCPIMDYIILMNVLEFNHAALTIRYKEDIKDFYVDLLGFEFVYDNELDEDLANTLFARGEKTYFCLLKRDGIFLELFVCPEKMDMFFTHLCFNVQNMNEMAAKTDAKGYSVIRKKRDNKDDLLFIMDKSGNRFELKNIS